MTHEEIRNFLLEEMRQGIHSVVAGEQKEFKTEFLCLNDIIVLLEDMGGDVDEEFDTNGWQWDFWQYVFFDDKAYCVGGSGYYGGVRVTRAEYKDRK